MSAETRSAQVGFGPVTGTRVTEACARRVARDIYRCARPVLNVYNRRLTDAVEPIERDEVPVGIDKQRPAAQSRRWPDEAGAV